MPFPTQNESPVATHDKEWQHHAQHDGVRSHHPPHVLGLDDPGRKRDALAELLLAIGVTKHLKVVATDFIRESFETR